MTTCIYTKLLSIFEESSKTYQAVLKLGIKTDTADYTGNIIRKDENVIMPCLNEINNVTDLPTSFSFFFI